jgi:hypothetical protein
MLRRDLQPRLANSMPQWRPKELDAEHPPESLHESFSGYPRPEA